MALIQVTPDLLRGQANQVRQIRDEHEAAMQKLTSLVNNLNAIWKGEAQDAFVAQYQSMQPTFRQFSELLAEYAQKMDNTANILEETDRSIASQLR